MAHFFSNGDFLDALFEFAFSCACALPAAGVVGTTTVAGSVLGCLAHGDDASGVLLFSEVAGSVLGRLARVGKVMPALLLLLLLLPTADADPSSS